MCVCFPYVSYIGFSLSTLADGCVCIYVTFMSVTSAFAGRLWQMGVCVFMFPLCQLHRLLLVDFGRWVCVCISLMSVTSALAGRLWQMGVCVFPLCQLHRLLPVDFGRRVCVYFPYIGFCRSTLADGHGCVYLFFIVCAYSTTM